MRSMYMKRMGIQTPRIGACVLDNNLNHFSDLRWECTGDGIDSIIC
jgi:hypothetical protein